MKRRLDSATRKQIIEEFENRCGYCRSPFIFSDSPPEFDHFIPLSKIEEDSNVDELSNLILSCRACNLYKGSFYPLDERGNLLILNPRTDLFSKHIRFDKDGLAIALTKRGERTIDVLKLNREAQVARRRILGLETAFYEGYIDSPPEAYKEFQKSIDTIRRLNSFEDPSLMEEKDYVLNMLYSNVITALESYFSDAFVAGMKKDPVYLRSFVSTFRGFKNEKIRFSDIFNEYEKIDEKVIEVLRNTLYHNIPMVGDMYHETFGISFPKFDDLVKSIFIRHDLVHRNGKTKDGKYHEIDKKKVEELCNMVEKFVTNIELQLKKKIEKTSD